MSASKSNSTLPIAGKGASSSELTAEDKILNIDDLNQSLWLVKVPQYVAERWSMADNDDILGSLKIVMKPAKGPKQPAGKQLNVKLSFNDGDDAPSEFTLEDQGMQAISGDTFVAFSNEPNSKRLCIDGKVTKNMHLMPSSSAQFGSILKERGEILKKKHEIHAADMNEIQKASVQSQFVEFIGNEADMKRKTRTSVVPSGDLNTSELRAKVFEAFAKTPKMIYREVKAFCSDVSGFSKDTQLREILDSYTVYHNKGIDKNYYELKQEYRDHSSK